MTSPWIGAGVGDIGAGGAVTKSAVTAVSGSGLGGSAPIGSGSWAEAVPAARLAATASNARRTNPIRPECAGFCIGPSGAFRPRLRSLPDRTHHASVTGSNGLEELAGCIEGDQSAEWGGAEEGRGEE